ncbi:triphosphoribosyl-dephospho-CoA synthase [Trinickia caryophylli]|uniref:Triphosphoribosyl-dephospho-CoA synthase n=1 Tax=Trinickia caryophylli TaxID=28094 RepID=A0A1X7E3F1_TRICW|nr:triphosphoribosyl-dephospho-CoA synthase [Trinickia caryophylli]PMS14020.1 triphosphoribosyl-dephospho-CoA synthase [Trinickia caryophylli]TRX17713.1 triphosphoribosyl-dephospho-CoA synthase [Trinickia caryophylli]WQE11527.1 triphosphoribosyl-dephospho-CoA synthase [Trinickia caryophylli]SMF26245.1 triphosphoribosyl-dephospho-CoA synthase [Trinickia caryophylli]GLU32693.1 triphosphoribosyl-dephospho-CoA synthase [Trinickia caryophylli]
MPEAIDELRDRAPAFAREAFLAACRLDVAVAKPGNVSERSAGHGMVAAQFIESARAAEAPLFCRGAPVGARVLGAVERTRAAVGCNTNLGIVLLVAPLAAALDTLAAQPDAQGWHAATEAVLARLDLDDARSAYRAIALANPGGLGDAPEQSVHAPPSVGLRAAMALAAERDSIARQYANGFADIFGAGLAAACAAGPGEAPGHATLDVFLTFLAGWPDSHIVRKHGLAVAQSVTGEACRYQRLWRDLMARGEPARAGELLAGWDAELKARGLNPGTSADLTVATLFVALALSGARTASPERTA